MKKPRRFQKIIDQIKKLSSEQPGLKDGRKTKNSKNGYNPEASGKHHSNRFELRHLHICYDILRGRESVIMKKSYFHEPTLSKMMVKYEPVPVLEAS